ncbi:heparinase II/III family protein [Pontivivens insulae]|uniref:heparinase II/III family protein n=1 Tax=Pontivivens insulae TaxID=1639689 RepID=UPI001B886586|nr:alginate lyase family protein [Pontivivens insulae]
MTELIAKSRRLWHTVRPLRSVQITNRIARRLARPKVRSFAPPVLQMRPERWQSAIRKPNSQLANGLFRFLNEEYDLARGGWDDPDVSKLWRYNLHYHDALVQKDPCDPEGLIAWWIEENPAPHGSGWEPYTVSLRIVNWVKFWLHGGTLDDAARASLAQQTDWLLQRIEWHLLGNHLYVNGKALVFASVLLNGSLGKRAETLGLRILLEETPEQFLDDGGQFERSPMYHALGLEDLLDLVNLCQSFDKPALRDLEDVIRPRIPAALRWMQMMSHPDGRIGLFNDAAFGIAAEADALNHYAERLGFGAEPVPEQGVHELAPSGYVRCQRGDTVALLDCAPLGPRYLPAHAHADTLSFELSNGAQRIVVNGGTSVYGLGPERAAQRGTAAHSTVVVDGRNSSDVWAGFRVGRQAYPLNLSITDEGVVTCEHDGYGPCTHARSWTLGATTLEVVDRLSGPFEKAEAFFHLHPDWVPVSSGEDDFVFRTATSKGGGVVFSFVGARSVEVEDGNWHPEFGRAVPNSCLRVRFDDRELITRISWAAAD